MVPRKWLSAGGWTSIPAGAECDLEVGPEGCGGGTYIGSVRDRCGPYRADYPDAPAERGDAVGVGTRAAITRLPLRS
jgi:hypothetical protein